MKEKLSNIKFEDDRDGIVEKASVKTVEELSTYKSWAPFGIPNHYTSTVSEEATSQGFIQKHPHYNNDNGSLYKIAEQLGLNAYEFDILKRIARCRKKGQFKEDLQKIKDTVDLYLKEQTQ